jgi:serine/threonine protein kinase
MSEAPHDPPLEDLLDRWVGEYSDRVAAGDPPAHAEYLARAPAAARAGLERCLKMIDAGSSRTPQASAALVPGVVLGRYRLLRELGRGGMALVWLARDAELDRPVALKLLRPGLALEARHVDRFRREALAIAKLAHRHIVQIHDVGSAAGWHFLAMEYVEGPSLASVLEALESRERWSADELARAAGIPALGGERTLEQALARLLAPIAGALEAAHESGLVHRDVKPSNILIRPDGTAALADFGLAKSEGDPALSMSGDTLGTPYYMSPEQAWLSEVQVDHRTDVYSLGVTLYEALSGRRPFDGRTVIEVFEHIRTHLPPALRSLEPRASRDATAVVRRAMSRDREARYASAADLERDLVALVEGLPTDARATAGGPLRRFVANVRLYTSGIPFEYRSERTLLGLPLVHVISRARVPGAPRRVARGWFASGERAVGVVACGQMAFGGVALGGIACGLVSWGGLSLGLLLGFGGLATGFVSIGGVSLGYLAIGGFAVGYGAFGGFARGVYAWGGNAAGEHVVTEGHEDPAAQEFFAELVSWFRRVGWSP